MSYEQKQEHTDAILDGLKRAPVECEVSNDGKVWRERRIEQYWSSTSPFFGTGQRDWSRFARPVCAKKRVPWTASEILVHGMFDISGTFVQVVASGLGRVWYYYDQGYLLDVSDSKFVDIARAVVRETLPSGQVVDTGRRLELWKEVPSE